MPELNIERERREIAQFNEWVGREEGSASTEEKCHMFTGWLAAKRAVAGSAEPVRQTNPHFETFPKQVWLNVGDCNEEELAEFSSHHEITWADSPIDKFDVEYVRADSVSPPSTDAKDSDITRLIKDRP